MDDKSMQIQAWVRQLIPGDHAMFQHPLTGKKVRLTITEVNSKGVITTDFGKFKYPGIGDRIVGYDGTMGWLFPEDDISKFAIPSKQTKTEKKKEAKLFCAAIVSGDIDLTYGLVEELLHVKRRHAREMFV